MLKKVLLISLVATPVMADQLPELTQFSAGTKAVAEDVNKNFSDLRNESNTQDERLLTLEQKTAFEEQLSCVVTTPWFHSMGETPVDCLYNNGGAAFPKTGVSQNQLSSEGWVPVELETYAPNSTATQYVVVYEKDPTLDILTCQVTPGWFDGIVGTPGDCVKFELGSAVDYDGTDHNILPGWKLVKLKKNEGASENFIAIYTRKKP